MFRQFVKKHATYENWAKVILAGAAGGSGIGLAHGIAFAALKHDMISCFTAPVGSMLGGLTAGFVAGILSPAVVPVGIVTCGVQKFVHSDTFYNKFVR
jgi:hypothetical protein